MEHVRLTADEVYSGETYIWDFDVKRKYFDFFPDAVQHAKGSISS